jgi:hypothetical protein
MSPLFTLRKAKKLFQPTEESHAVKTSKLAKAITNTILDAATMLTLGSGAYLVGQGFDVSDTGKIAVGTVLGIAGLKIYRYSIRRGFRHRSKY